jgi:sugar phosphate isomerase/epimerase
MFTLSLGISLSSVLQQMNWEYIDCLAKTPIRTFEMNAAMFAADYDGALRRAFCQMLQQSGKRVLSYHIPFSRLDDISDPDEVWRQRALSRFRALLREAEFFQAEMLVVHPSTEPVNQQRRTEHAAQLRRSLQELEGELKAKKMRLALEFLPRLCMGNTLADMDIFLDGMSDTFGVCQDVNHLMGQYQEIPAMARTLKEKLFTLHISDYDGVDERHWLPGQGVIDWQAFVAALKDVNYTGPFNYEIRINTDLDIPGRLQEIVDNFSWIESLL